MYSHRGPNSCLQGRLKAFTSWCLSGFQWDLSYELLDLLPADANSEAPADLSSAAPRQALRTKFLKVSKCVEVLPGIFLSALPMLKATSLKLDIGCVQTERVLAAAGPSDGWLVASKEVEQPVCMVPIRRALPQNLCGFL